MKRSAPLKRRSSLRSGKPPKKKGPGKAKREARYQAYLRSAKWKEKKRQVRERSGGQCERRFETWDDVFGTTLWRCAGKARVCNHRTYARFGDENLEDLEDLCDPCNDAWESEHRPWNRGQLGRAS